MRPRRTGQGRARKPDSISLEERLEVARFISDAMHAAGMTKADLARATGISESTVSNYTNLTRKPYPMVPEGPNFMRIMKAVGRRKGLAGSVPANDPVLVRLQALEAKVDAQTDATEKAIQGLTRAIRRLSKQRDVPGAQADSR